MRHTTGAFAATRKRVVIVDDSAVLRRVVRKILEADERLLVVGEAGHPQEARRIIRETEPDVITLDVEMPQMDGISFLEKIMQLRPMPVVMLSSVTQAGSENAVRALALGAIECIDKASIDMDLATDLSERVYAASCARMTEPATAIKAPPKRFNWNGKVVLIGSSTGGVEALERVLRHFPADGPPTVIVQHMPAKFLANFAVRLDNEILPKVSLAGDLTLIEQGAVFLAPGGEFHTELTKVDGGLATQNVQKAPISGHRPSVDALFQSALSVGPDCVCAILTGMGRDGAAGMLALRKAGAETVAQDKLTSTVFGMPRAAAEIGGTEALLPLDEIGPSLLKLCSKANSGGAA